MNDKKFWSLKRPMCKENKNTNMVRTYEYLKHEGDQEHDGKDELQ
jgi:hypothetical protein